MIQFRENLAGAMRGHHESRKRLEVLLINSQQAAFQNPFVSCSFSYTVARGFANAGDTTGVILTVEGPWHSGIDYEFLRRLFGLYGSAFDYLQEFGLPESLNSPFVVIKLETVDP